MTKELFFDTDCLSSFLWINNTNLLQILYGGRIVIPDSVYQELCNPCIPHLKKRVDVLVDGKDASIWKIETGTEEYALYHSLVKGRKGTKAIGKGEAAGIALAKTYDGILASNNYADIGVYIRKYNLKHIDTGHILLEALGKGIITENDGDVLWRQMRDKNRQLPAENFGEYLCRNR